MIPNAVSTTWQHTRLAVLCSGDAALQVQNLVWDDNLQLLKQFVQEQGRLPKQHELYAGVKLGNWCGNERMRKRRGWISNEQQQALEDVAHWTWTKAPQKVVQSALLSSYHLLIPELSCRLNLCTESLWQYIPAISLML